jgi:hypothetical protein
MQRTQWSAALLAVLLFGAGMVAGALGHRYYLARQGAPGPPGQAARERYVADMKSRLKLTAKQVDDLEDILDDTRSKFRAAHETCRPAMSKVKDEQISEVKAILTPAQIPLYDRLLAEREERAKEQEARDRKAEEQEAAARKARVR